MGDATGSSNWEALSAERKALQAEGTVPGFMTTAGYAMVKANPDLSSGRVGLERGVVAGPEDVIVSLG